MNGVENGGPSKGLEEEGDTWKVLAEARWWEDGLGKWNEGRRREEQLPFLGPQESGLHLKVST